MPASRLSCAAQHNSQPGTFRPLLCATMSKFYKIDKLGLGLFASSWYSSERSKLSKIPPKVEERQKLLDHFIPGSKGGYAVRTVGPKAFSAIIAYFPEDPFKLVGVVKSNVWSLQKICGNSPSGCL